MNKEELQKLYGEAVLQSKIWTAKATDYERQLLDLINRDANHSSS